MTATHNPYADALKGLEIEDPVAAFFNFCKERESIRLKREKGEPGPWTKDEVLQRGRFLNIFREDDRGTKALLKFVQPLADQGDINALVQGLFFARWCNRDHTLNEINPELISDPSALQKALQSVTSPPWCNFTAYPVQDVTWEGKKYNRKEAATELFHKIAPWLVETIKQANKDVVAASKAIGTALGMTNDFPVFMAVMDLAWFRPDLIDPASPVPTGIGAVAFLDLLQKHLGLKTHEETANQMIMLQERYWPEAKRPFQPIDIEYLSCECRKYYSYINGTKTYEGKNVFVPGKSPMVTFGIIYQNMEVKPGVFPIYVLAGGPCSGKTSLRKALSKKGYKTVPETAEVMLKRGLRFGIKAEEKRKDPHEWQMDLLFEDFGMIDKLMEDYERDKDKEITITDTSFIETVVFSYRAGIEITPAVEDWINIRRYKMVFFLEPIENYEKTQVRMESKETASKISQEIQEAYAKYGYKVIYVPSMSVEDRCNFVETKIKESNETPESS